MPEQWYKTVAKHSKEKTGEGTTAKKVKKYRKAARKDVPSDVKDPEAYATAVALRRAQKTGSEPHKKLSNEEAEQIARDSILEAIPEFVSFVEGKDYRSISGIYEETSGVSDDGRFFGAVADTSELDEPTEFYRIILIGPDAEKAAQAASMALQVPPDQATPNNIVSRIAHFLLSENTINEGGLHCPKCDSDNVLAGTKTLKHHCSACGHEWGEGDDPKKADETTTGAIGNVMGGGTRRKKKEESISPEDVADGMDESYNDNYERPNQRERRTNLRQADGTNPPIGADEDIIKEQPKKKKRKKR